MPTVTVAGSNNQVYQLNYNTNDAAGYAQGLESSINAQILAGSLTMSNYTSGKVAPAGATASAVFFGGDTLAAGAVLVPNSVAAVVDSAAGPVSIWGGSGLQSVLAGSGGLSFYAASAPTGLQTIVAGDGANWISTQSVGGGNYRINLGSGNDTVRIDTGNATVNMGTGNNVLSLGNGSSVVVSVGADLIVGSSVAGGGGSDTVQVTSGRTTINPGSSNFTVFGNESNPLTMLRGSGTDLVAMGIGGGTVTAGSGGNSTIIGGLNSPNGPAAYMTGTADGDKLYAIGYGNVVAVAGAGNETITGAGNGPFGGAASHGSNSFTAGSGNDTLISGAGQDTLTAGTGNALMVAGIAADTFAFQQGKAGGSDTISGFKVGVDTLLLTGYGFTPSSALGTSLQLGGGTVLTFADGTTVTVAGVSNFSSSNIKVG